MDLPKSVNTIKITPTGMITSQGILDPIRVTINTTSHSVPTVTREDIRLRLQAPKTPQTQLVPGLLLLSLLGEPTDVQKSHSLKRFEDSGVPPSGLQT